MSAGGPMFGVKVKADSETGEILVQSSYAGTLFKSDEALPEWIPTGDKCALLPNGSVFFTDKIFNIFTPLNSQK